MKSLPVLDSARIAQSDLRAWPLEYLRHLHLEMGQQCNVRCSMCYQTDFAPSSRLADVAWKENLRSAYPLIDTLVLQGGEPTVLPNCRELVEMVIRDYPNIHLETVTNGVLWKGLWEEAFLAQGRVVNFSLNAIDPELYSRVVQFGRQSEVISNIDRIVRRRREQNSKMVLRLSTVVLQETIHELPVFVQWAADHGADEVIFHIDPVLSARHEDTKFVQNHISAAYETAERNPQVKLYALNEFDWYYAQKKNIAPVRERSLFARPSSPCSVAFDSLFVAYSGIARVCCKSWYPLGNLCEQTVEEVWKSRQTVLFRQRMLELDFRDCPVACDLNAAPVDHRVAIARKAYWSLRREPRKAYRKALRSLGLTTAQLDLPVQKS
ncbi:MAG: radical SAM protein [Calditrichaeota bacterium]|nr:radical SAM protein [Calditrichota bacterium]MCB9367372.1 radical SAM protein [Calditrichota bacterium]MCB9391338.1 radical SAM protein [Calditrichota bacterium]